MLFLFSLFVLNIKIEKNGRVCLIKMEFYCCKIAASKDDILANPASLIFETCE
jgi:hypothetical protein